MPDKAEQLRALHQSPPILVLPNAWDAATARLFEKAGFPAVATTSAGVAAALGYADGGAVPPNEMIEAIARMARAVTVPLTADIEYGYATAPDAVADVVLRVIAAGAVGVNLEDYLPGSAELVDLTLQADKIEAVVRAASIAGVRVVVNARTDVYLQEIGDAARRLEVAIERGRAFRKAGADCVFVPGVRDAATIRELVSGIGGPINILAGGGVPSVPELEKLGVARVSVGSGPMRASLALVREAARELKAAGTYTSFTARALPYDELNDLMR
jgi:2-methylisocitrate lyase-like PEP mutase family enzyme